MPRDRRMSDGPIMREKRGEKKKRGGNEVMKVTGLKND